jgi:hypothetical protein
VAEHLKLSIGSIALFDGSSPLAESAWVKQDMNLRVLELAPFSVRLVTGCCGEAFPDVGVQLDGESKGFTDSQGNWSSVATVGMHTLTFVLRPDGVSMTRKVTLTVAESNKFVFPSDVSLRIYCTDPEAEAESEGEVEEECQPNYDPSCVWVGVDPSQIPDDAKAVRGLVRCEYSEDETSEAVPLNGDDITPLTLCFEIDEEERGKCPLTKLSVECTRDRYCWRPKDISPLAERAAALGGCELIRLLMCPVALGFLKPAVAIHFPDGSVGINLSPFAKMPTGSMVLPLEEHGEVAALRKHLSEELGELPKNIELVDTDMKPLWSTYLEVPIDLLCVRKGAGEQAALAAALDALQRRRR